MRFIIFVEGGLVQEVLCSERCEYLIIDKDVLFEPVEIVDTTGEKFTGAIDAYEETAHPDSVDHYYNQVKA